MANNGQLVITLQNGDTIEVQTTLEDRLAFETALRKNKGWGDLKDNAMKMQPFMAWNAARRTGKTELTWAEFTTGDTAALDVSAPDEHDDDGSDELDVEGLGKDTPKGRSTTSRSSSRATTAARRGSGEDKTDPS